MAELAAKTMIYRGLGSGIIRVMREKAHIDFENEESGNQFKATIWRTTQKSGLKDSNTIQKTIQKSDFTTQKSSFTTQKSSFTTQKSSFTTQKDEATTQKDEATTQKDEATTQKRVLEYLKEYPKATRVETAEALGNITEDGVKFIISKLQEKGLLKRVGGRKLGEWKVLI